MKFVNKLAHLFQKSLLVRLKVNIFGSDVYKLLLCNCRAFCMTPLLLCSVGTVVMYYEDSYLYTKKILRTNHSFFIQLRIGLSLASDQFYQIEALSASRPLMWCRQKHCFSNTRIEYLWSSVA